MQTERSVHMYIEAHKKHNKRYNESTLPPLSLQAAVGQNIRARRQLKFLPDTDHHHRVKKVRTKE